jgi:hypothetical protein
MTGIRGCIGLRRVYYDGIGSVKTQPSHSARCDSKSSKSFDGFDIERIAKDLAVGLETVKTVAAICAVPIPRLKPGENERLDRG